MKKIALLVILAGLLLVGAGCGGGGGSSSGSQRDIDTTDKTIDMRNPARYDLGLRYTVTTSKESSNTVTMYITSIEVASNKTLVVNCAWEATNNSGCERITKMSDKNNDDLGGETFYMRDNKDKVYYHTSGTGAAYTETELSSTAVSGSFKFPALDRGVTSIYFYDKTYNKTFGPIAVSGLN